MPILAQAKIYRFPVEAEVKPLERPAKGLEKLPKVFRVLYSNHYNAPAIEFTMENGKLERLSTYQAQMIPPVTRVAVDSCEASVLNSRERRQQELGQMFLDIFTRGTPDAMITRQALSEMAGRKYITPEEAGARGSENMPLDNQAAYLETLTWVTAREALDFFAGQIPWDRVAEIEAPDWQNEKRVKEMAQAGHPDVHVRIRRATMRMYPRMTTQINGRGTIFSSYQKLPFETELWNSGRQQLIPRENSAFTFELGRATQLPGLAHEARELAALATLVMAYRVIMYKPSEVLSPETKAYLHSLKPANTRLYIEALGAKVVPGLDLPEDTVLEVSLMKLMEKLKDILPMSAVELFNSRELQKSKFYVFDLATKNFDFLPPTTILVLPSQKPKKQIVNAAHYWGGQDLAYLPNNWEEHADFVVTGFGKQGLYNDDKYLGSMALAISRQLLIQGSTGRIAFVSDDSILASRAQTLGFKVFEYVGKDSKVRYFVSASTEVLQRIEAARSEQDVKNELEAKPSAQWKIFDLVNMFGLM